jgi:hypothetical protein
MVNPSTSCARIERSFDVETFTVRATGRLAPEADDKAAMLPDSVKELGEYHCGTQLERTARMDTASEGIYQVRCGFSSHARGDQFPNSVVRLAVLAFAVLEGSRKHEIQSRSQRSTGAQDSRQGNAREPGRGSHRQAGRHRAETSAAPDVGTTLSWRYKLVREPQLVAQLDCFGLAREEGIRAYVDRDPIQGVSLDLSPEAIRGLNENNVRTGLG